MVMQLIPKPYYTKEFFEAIELLNKKNSLYEEFDYPDYAGLPKRISSKLTSEEVDYIQNYWSYE